VLGHDHLSVNGNGVAVAHALKRFNEEVTGFGGNELRLPVKATEGDRVRLSGFVETAKTGGHDGTLLPFLCRCSDGQPEHRYPG
jgi:hypothetical protein